MAKRFKLGFNFLPIQWDGYGVCHILSKKNHRFIIALEKSKLVIFISNKILSISQPSLNIWKNQNLVQTWSYLFLPDWILELQINILFIPINLLMQYKNCRRWPLQNLSQYLLTSNKSKGFLMLLWIRLNFGKSHTWYWNRFNLGCQ